MLPNKFNIINVLNLYSVVQKFNPSQLTIKEKNQRMMTTDRSRRTVDN